MPAISRGDVAFSGNTLIDSHDFYIQYMKHWDSMFPSFFETEATVNNENTI